MTKKELILTRLSELTTLLTNSPEKSKEVFAKEGEVTKLLRLLRFVPAFEKPEVGAKINEFVNKFQKE